MYLKTISLFIVAVCLLGCGQGGNEPGNSSAADTMAVSVDTSAVPESQGENARMDEEIEAEGELFPGRVVTKEWLSKAGITVTEIYGFPEKLLPVGCEHAYFGIDKADDPIFYYVFYGRGTDTFTVVSGCQREGEDAFHPVSCFGGPSVEYENGILTETCEENGNIYTFRFRMKGKKLLFIGDESEDSNEETFREMEEAVKANDPEKYCELCTGVQYQGPSYLENCLSNGLSMAVDKAAALIKMGKQNEANRLIQSFTDNYKETIPDDSLWAVLGAMKR